ncbi:rhomboid-like protein 14, mitochondrial isoform X1 [Lycium barbarum]|uniref:rhomboid-like protein 14, mitochondrial isoform X1 n=1 Tax=Lycium barbarum TaxID=112863 RepID=UPI00293EAC69|nr:rhomboid-like protein 14, mitochondrial isoform X1 [Lycium barbarum]
MERGSGKWGSISRGMIPLLALHTVSEYSRLDRKPPITASLLAANTLIYLRPKFLNYLLPTTDQVWFNPHLIFKYKDLKRFFLSPFFHINESHLVYNMLSLLWKGIQLETSMGSAEFTSMVATLVSMSQGVTLLLAKSLLIFFDYERPYYNEYSLGFSGVLFAMKVVANAQSDEYTYIHGLMVPTRYAAWAELILIQMFVPGVSFLGHLGGILAGLLYLRLKASYSGPNPVRQLMRGFSYALNWPLRLVKSLLRIRPRITGRGTTGGRNARDTLQMWRCQACTFDNSGRLNVCEMCGTGRADDGPSSPVPTSEIHDLSLEELRRRRIERFGR